MNCSGCYGSGEILGLGQMKTKCPMCNGSGKVAGQVETSPQDPISKTSEEYLEAKAKIKEAAPNLSDKEIEQVLDNELQKSKEVKDAQFLTNSGRAKKRQSFKRDEAVF